MSNRVPTAGGRSFNPTASTSHTTSPPTSAHQSGPSVSYSYGTPYSPDVQVPRSVNYALGKAPKKPAGYRPSYGLTRPQETQATQPYRSVNYGPVNPVTRNPSYGITRPQSPQPAQPYRSVNYGPANPVTRNPSYGITRPQSPQPAQPYRSVNYGPVSPVTRTPSYGMTRAQWNAANQHPPRTGASPAMSVPRIAPRINPARLTRAFAPAGVATALDFGMGLLSGESPGRAAAGAIGSGIGFGVGMLIGTAIPIPGAGFVGGYIGSILGSMAGDWIYNKLFPNDSMPSLSQQQERGPAPAFYGGQEPGVYYGVEAKVSSFDQLVGVGVYGPIYDIVFTPGYNLKVIARTSQFDATPKDHQLIGGTDLPGAEPTRLTYLRVFRADGQPDTGGNPASAPGAPNQPALAPITAPSPQVFPAPTQSPVSPVNSANLSPATPTDPFTPQKSQAETNPHTPSAPIQGWTPRPLVPPSDSQQGIAPIWNPIGAMPLGLLPALALAPAALGSRGSPTVWRPPSTTSSITTGGETSTPSTVCRFRPDPYTPSISQRTQQMEIVELAIQSYQARMLTQVDTKLGPQVTGGLSGYLKNFWKWFHIDRLLNLFTFWVTIHNAIMLSNNLGQTLFGLFDTVLEIFKQHLKDDEGNEISTSEWAGGEFDKLLKSVFGDQNAETVKAVWNKANRIYQAAANILNSVQSMFYSVAEILETISNYTGRIGNSLKRSGEVLENSFNWMNTSISYTNNKFFRWMQNLQDGVEAISNVASEVLNITETFSQLGEHSEAMKKEISDGEVKESKKEKEDIAKETPDPLLVVEPKDELKAEVD